jgi:hypothetical protein
VTPVVGDEIASVGEHAPKVVPPATTSRKRERNKRAKGEDIEIKRREGWRGYLLHTATRWRGARERKKRDARNKRERIYCMWSQHIDSEQCGKMAYCQVSPNRCQSVIPTYK